MKMTFRTTTFAAACLLLALPYLSRAEGSCSGIAIGQKDFPFTPAGGSSYCLTGDVVVPSGTAINAANRSNWQLDLNGFRIRYAQTGYGMWANLQNVHSATITNGSLVQGDWKGRSDSIVLGSGRGSSGLEISNITAHVKGVGTGTLDVSWLMWGNGEIVNSEFELTGRNRLSLLNKFSGGFRNSKVFIKGLRGELTYPRIFNDLSNFEFVANKVVVDASSTRVNLFAIWGGSNAVVEDNEFVWNTDGTRDGTARMFILDAGANNWKINHNRFTFGGKIASGGDQYLLAIRRDQAASDAPHDIEFSHNVVDSTAVQGEKGLLRIIAAQTDTRRVRVHHNLMQGYGNMIHTTNASTDYDVFCNVFDHKDPNGMAFYAKTSSELRRWNLAYNKFSVRRTDGLVAKPGTGLVQACGNEGFDNNKQVEGGSNMFEFTQGNCEVGSHQCWVGEDIARLSPNPPVLRID